MTRLPGAVPQLIGLFLFCIEFGWGWTKLNIVLCMNLLVEVEIRWHTEFGRISFRIGSNSNFEFRFFSGGVWGGG